MRIALSTLICAGLLFAQAPSAAESDMPAMVTFVAPAYPRAAKDQRKMGKTLTRITVNSEGIVTEVNTISANHVFEGYVLEALKQWRFKPSTQEHTLQVTCSFEFDDQCEGTDKHPVTSETPVSAELPTVVHIRTGLQCIETSVSREQH